MAADAAECVRGDARHQSAPLTIESLDTRYLSYPVSSVWAMSTVLEPPPRTPFLPGRSPQASAWAFAEGEAVAVMGTVNQAVARLVTALRVLLDTDGWEGAGIRSPEHWVTWKAGMSRSRAEGLVRIARRSLELPACFSLFAEGRLGEDAMVRIARRVPAGRDAEVAAMAPTLLIPQLDRLLRALPEQPDGAPSDPAPGPERMCQLRERRDGWLRGEFCLPPDEGALLQIGSSNWLVISLAALSVLIATINLVGGFLVTRRMLAMFQKS